jgi:16S rRNA (guanine527-N7)-methyltransferase
VISPGHQAAQLDAGARSLLKTGATQLQVDLSDGQLDSLSTYAELLLRWSGTYNLTAIRDPREVVTHHLLDCLAVVPPLRRELDGAAGQRLLDVGSGAGLPGLVLATAEPRVQVVCIDSVGKKAAFITQAAGTLRLANLQAVHGRVETLALPPFDVIVSRAFASLASFVSATEPHLRKGGFWMAMKGKQPAEEIEELQGKVEWRVESLQVPQLAVQRCLVWMRKMEADSEM